MLDRTRKNAVREQEARTLVATESRDPSVAALQRGAVAPSIHRHCGLVVAVATLIAVTSMGRAQGTALSMAGSMSNPPPAPLRRPTIMARRAAQHS